MRIGKFEIKPMYDMQCCKCGDFRSNIGFCGSIFTKPTAKTLKKEGWRYIEGVGQVCPECYERIKNGL